jgi:hypothetical protein
VSHSDPPLVLVVDDEDELRELILGRPAGGDLQDR